MTESFDPDEVTQLTDSQARKILAKMLKIQQKNQEALTQILRLLDAEKNKQYKPMFRST